MGMGGNGKPPQWEWKVSHCLHHMLPPSRASLQVALRPRGHNYDVPRVTYDLTKRSFLLRCLYREKNVLCGLSQYVNN